MNKNYVLIVITFLCAFLSAFGQVSDLIISEYAEGSGNNKYIEVYNGTGAAVDLSDYELWRIANGGFWSEFTLSLSGTLADGATYVVANPSANPTILAAADLTDIWCQHSGDDAVGLAKDIAGTFTLIDAVGEDGPDPGAGWNVAGVTNGTANHTLTRKTDTCSPNTNWTTSAGTTVANSEWVVLANDIWTDIGTHTSVCTDTYVRFVNTASTITEDGVFIDICVSILNPSGSTATTVDIILNGSSSATNGTDYDDGAGVPAAISFPQTLTFPAGSSANQCLTIYISNDDIIYEGDETVVLDLNNPTGGTSASLTSNAQHVLTILDNETPVIADVLITEIMYNTAGLDDEWIEICNTTGVPQVLNGYSIEVDGFTEFTFPLTGASIAPGDCITIALGNDGDAEFNDGSGSLAGGYCPFVPDYSNGSGPGTLSNSSGTIEIIASDATTVVDTVDYSATDGGNGNGSSLHFNPNASDNSDTGTDWHEVAVGGSAGTNVLISPCDTPAADINITRNTFSTIPSGSNANIGYNTIFAATPINSSTAAKTYYIINEGNLDLTITSISLDTGTNFSLQNLPSLPLTISQTDPPVSFEVVFNPLSPIGTKTDTVRIENTDPDASEDPYTFDVQGEAVCAATAISILPTSGPENTVITVTGTDLLTATATFNGLPASAINNISSTEMEVTVPSGAVSGTLEILDDSGCPATAPFTVIDNQIASCDGASLLSELFISEVTDATYGSLTYIELYNPTASDIDLSSYEIRIYANGSNGTQIPNASTNPAPAVQQLSGTILAGQTFVLTTGTTPPLDDYLCSVPGGDGSYGDQTSNTLAGVNITSGGHDFIGLYATSSSVTDPPIDAFGGFADDDWMNSLSTPITGTRGFNFRRLNTATPLPNATFNENQWTIIDWTGSGSSTCVSTNDYSEIGSYDFSTGTPPIITDQPDPVAPTCNLTASFSLTATEGYSGGLSLAYQWFVYVPGVDGWSPLSNNATYSGVNTDTLNVLNTIGIYNHQYYCQVRENTNTCYTASHAVRITTPSTTWVSPGTWDNGAPDINTITVLDYNYDTFVSGSFSACQLFVNASATLTISNNTFVEVDTDLIVDGNVIVRPYASFVQIDDLGLVTGDVLSTRNKIVVEKRTAVLNSADEYAYWSSPVSGETIGNGLNESGTTRRFLFNAENFLDSEIEVMNNNSTNSGQDDIDDNGDDWQQVSNASTVMAPGVGYAATHSIVGYTGPGNQYLYTFEGPFNNGVYNVPVYRNDAETNDNNWNFIGNPYPSAISFANFMAQNLYSGTNTSGALEGAIYLWSHETNAAVDANGNEVYNYAQSDYATINGSGGVAGGDMVIPNSFIPSGQGFFVSMSDNTTPTTVVSGTFRTADVVFNNSMRALDNNDLFFRNSSITLANKLRINLTSDNGVFNQILVAYIDGATDSNDGKYYDAPRNLSTGANSILYSIIEDSIEKFAIQGKSTGSLNLDEVIPLGFYTSITEATIYTLSIADLEGDFMNSNTIYVKDRLLNTIHNLTENDYNFTSETGDFKNRFEIVFQSDALSIGENTISSNQLTIIELQDGSVKFSVGNALTINKIEIIDLLGRTLYNLKGTRSTELFELHNLSQTAYIAKVTLSNGQTIIKRAIKRH